MNSTTPHRSDKQNSLKVAEFSRTIPRFHADMMGEVAKSGRHGYSNSTILRLVTKRMNYGNFHQIPLLKKVVISRGVGSNRSASALNASIQEFRAISGQQPCIRKATESVAGFKLRQGQAVGVMVTLRSKKMEAFITKLVHVILPRLGDFQGLRASGFDGHGNFNFGLTEQAAFPELADYESPELPMGFNISIETGANSDHEGLNTLKALGLPFRDDGDTQMY